LKPTKAKIMITVQDIEYIGIGAQG